MPRLSSIRLCCGAGAVRMVPELAPDYPSQYAAICAAAKKPDIGTAETLRK